MVFVTRGLLQSLLWLRRTGSANRGQTAWFSGHWETHKGTKEGKGVGCDGISRGVAETRRVRSRCRGWENRAEFVGELERAAVDFARAKEFE
ncbi:MAG: hypothetical protein DWQ34_07470 [Planctomycetota bacterium]|nr:MAG: hypothetical protein DWQ34_07470 [Planctomycetota bacterium]REK27279.1 MAG: hypothetical protein DWQ41_07890 [Planctomycetota bacterium]REK36700.1 MAG: hypothetical protein DWQ45_08745 [Planctomycetota bacterium]